MVNRELDEQERLIVRTLIRNPRSSDNDISRRTKVPVMTVNRKRKAMEKEGLLLYMTRLVHGPSGVGIQNLGELFVIKFKLGMTEKEFKESMRLIPHIKEFSKYVTLAYLGSYEGHIALIVLVGGKTLREVNEVFHDMIVKSLRQQFGEDAIEDVFSISITDPVRMVHNYLPTINIENAHIKDDWRDEWIFVD